MVTPRKMSCAFRGNIEPPPKGQARGCCHSTKEGTSARLEGFLEEATWTVGSRQERGKGHFRRRGAA